jgi:cytochrome P450
MKWQFGTPGTMFAAINAQLHRARRSSLNPFFSKRKIVELEPRIKLQIDKMCQRLEMEYSGMDKVLRFDHMIASVTIDIVTNYAFGKSYNFVEAPDFVSPFTSMAESFKKAAQLSVQFPWLPRLFASLPESWVAAINPIVIPSLQFRRVRLISLH